jgi:hypothetical protein
MNETVLDNQINPVKVPKLDTLMFSLRDSEYIYAAKIKREHQNLRRLKNWTGAHYVKVETAD